MDIGCCRHLHPTFHASNVVWASNILNWRADGLGVRDVDILRRRVDTLEYRSARLVSAGEMRVGGVLSPDTGPVW